MGIRYRDVTNNLLPGQTDDLYHWNEGFIDNFTNSEFKGYSLSLSAGVKIGFRYK